MSIAFRFYGYGFTLVKYYDGFCGTRYEKALEKGIKFLLMKM